MNAMTLPALALSAASSPTRADAFPAVADLLARAASEAPDASDAPPTALVILGRDEQDRPHASRFAGCDGGAVAAAAAMMNMVVLPVTGDPLAQLAAKLPEGRLFASGKAFVPFVGGPLFSQLVSYTPVADRAALEPGAQRKAMQAAKGDKGGGKTGSDAPAGSPEPASSPTPPPAAGAPSGELIPGVAIKPGTLPKDWDAIRPLMMVLATMEGYDSWWPAEVAENKGDGLFALKWVDGGEELFLRRAEQLALLHPSYRGM